MIWRHRIKPALVACWAIPGMWICDVILALLGADYDAERARSRHAWRSYRRRTSGRW